MADWQLTSQWLDDGSKTGQMRLTLVGPPDLPLPPGARLAYTSITRIPPGTELVNACFYRRVANYHELGPGAPDPQADGRHHARWTILIPRLSHRPAHSTDGPKSAFLILPEGKTIPVTCRPLAPECAQEKAETPTGTPTGAPDEQRPEALAARGADALRLGLLPAPNRATIASWRDGTPLRLHLPASPTLCVRLNGLIGRLFGVSDPLFDSKGGDITIHLERTDRDTHFAPEGFSLCFEAGEEVIHLIAPAGQGASDDRGEGGFGEDGFGAGHFYGLVALAQMVRAANTRPDLYGFPAAGMIEDWPHQSWRGAHLDVSRQFYAPQSIFDFLDILAWHRLNRFHWHLTDDEGWRLESRAYPRLTEVGAVRGHGLPLLPQHGSGAAPYGGFYSQEDVSAMIVHGRSLHIDIVPEIDVPGHCHAALMALPDLVDPSAMAGGASVQGYVNNALNPGLATTWGFLETLFDEVANLFPSPFVHIGGDEVADNAWAGSRAAQSWARARGLINAAGKGETMAMQAALLRFVQKRLTAAGKITLAWEEAAKGGGLDPDKAILMAWMKAESGAELTRQGYQVIMCPGEAYYLDMAQSTDWQEPGLSWAGTSSPEQSYAFDPYQGLGESEEQCLGLQGCIWSENLTNRALFNHMVFPRLSAIAERAWTVPERCHWPGFAVRALLMPQMPEMP